jgi:glycosyltransferase involved in cell wall biosynthesis
MSNQTVLIVMPVYNSEKTLGNAIKSILNQTYKNFKLVIVDDASTDNSLEIAKSYLYDKRVSLYQNEINMGAYYSRNIGLYLNRGHDWDFFTTHDADDISYIRRLETLTKIINKNSLNSAYDIFVRKDLYTQEEISRSLTIAHMIFKRSVFNEIGYFETVRFGADWEYWRRLSANNRHVKKNTIAWRKALGESYIHGSNLTVQIPMDSEPRKSYIAQTVDRLNKIKNQGDLYTSFYPSIKTNKIHNENISFPVSKNKVTVVLLTWQRIHNLENTLSLLSNQTYKDFDVHISNGNISKSSQIEQISKNFLNLNIKISHDGNDIFAFRRFTVGKRLFESGTEVVLFIDDDITFPETYIETCISQYEPKTYKSGFTWVFFNRGRNYYKFRKRVHNNEVEIHYAGTGISMIDASIFKDNRLLEDAPTEFYTVEDLWLSYFVKHKHGWKVLHMETPGIIIGGNDKVALFKKVLKDEIDKAELLRMLLDMGWQIPAKLPPKLDGLP